MDVLRIDIAELLVRRAGNRLGDAYQAFWNQTTPDLDEFGQQSLREQEAEAAIESVLLFQSGIEAMINEEISTNPKLQGVRRERDSLQKRLKDMTFKNKWEHSFQALGISPVPQVLERYLLFYRSYRVPITHPRNRYLDVSAYRFPLVYQGIRAGWLSFMQLSTTWESEARNESWERFCEECGLPNSVDQHDA